MARDERAEQPVDRRVGGHDVELGVQHERGVRQVTVQYAVEQVQQRNSGRPVDPGVGAGGRETGAEQHLVRLTKRDLQRFGQAKDHVSTGCGASGLDVGQVSGRRSATTVHGSRLAVSPATVRRLLLLLLLLTVDSAGCALLGLVAVVTAGALKRPLGAPMPLLVAGGLVLFVYAVAVALGLAGVSLVVADVLLRGTRSAR